MTDFTKINVPVTLVLSALIAVALGTFWLTTALGSNGDIALKEEISHIHLWQNEHKLEHANVSNQLATISGVLIEVKDLVAANSREIIKQGNQSIRNQEILNSILRQQAVK